MTLKELRDTSGSAYEFMVVSVRHIAKLPEHDITETICGMSRDDEMFLDVDGCLVISWKIKIGIGGIPYLSVQTVHEESEGA